VLAATAEVLVQMQHLLDDEQWEKAVQILDRARSVLCYGSGRAGSVADFLAIELSWNGCPARCLRSTGLDVATGLLSLTRDEAVVLIAPLRHFREADVVIDRAHEVGAPVILVSEALGMALADRVDVVLATPQSTLTLTTEVLAPMTLAHALALDLAARHREQAVTTHELVSRLRRQVVDDDVDVTPPPAAGVSRRRGRRGDDRGEA
jgi:DNA-binding MurR/RpiR family transcriptional regulator